MATPQAIFSGIGGAGNDLGTAMIQHDQTQHQYLMDYLANQARSRQLDQTSLQNEREYKLQQGAQDIQRQTLNGAGWEDGGVQRKTDGSYQRTWVKPSTGQSFITNLPTPPPESFEYQNDLFKRIKSTYPNMDDDQAVAIAFKAPYMAKQDPASILNQNFKFFTNNPKMVPKGKTPQQASQDLLDLFYGRGAALRPEWSWPNAANLSGMTQGQKREYDAQRLAHGLPAREQQLQTQLIQRYTNMRSNINLMFDPAALQKETENIESWRSSTQAILDKENQDIAEAILGNKKTATVGVNGPNKVAHKVGDVVSYKGQQYRISGIDDKGNAQLGPL